MDHVDAAIPDRGPAGVHERFATESFNLHAALRSVCDQAHDVLGWRVVLLMLNDESAGLCCVVAASGLSTDLRELLIGAGLGASDELPRWLEGQARVSRSYLLNCLGAGTHFSLADITGEATDATRAVEQAVVVPLEVRGKLLGALVAYDVGAAEYVSQARVRILELIGLNAAALVDQALSESARRDLESLFALTQALAEIEDLGDALRRILGSAEKMLRCEAAAILLFDEALGTLAVEAQVGFPATVDALSIRVDNGGPAALAVRNRAAVFMPAAGSGQVLRSSSASVLALPLLLGESLIGVLLLESDTPHAFGERERSLAPALAREAAVAIHRVQLFDKIALGKREWEATFDAMSDGVFLLNRERRVVRANQAGAALVGSTASGIRGFSCCALFCPPDSCASQSALESGSSPSVLARSRTGITGLVNVSAIRNRSGEITGAVAVVRPSGDAPEGGGNLEARVGQALVESPEAVLMLDRAASVCWANHAAEALFGPSLGLLTGLSALVVERDRARVQAAFARALAGEATAIDTLSASDGREIELDFSPPLGGSQPESVLVLARDLGADQHHSQMTSQAERLRSLTTFARGVARELLMDVAAFEVRAGSDPAAAGLELVRGEAPLIERLHALGRLRRDRVQAMVDLNRIIAESIEETRSLWEAAAEARGVRYEIHFEPCGTPSVLGSPRELRSVFEELVRNAVWAQPAGGRIDIRVAERQNLAAAQVSDAGAGMTEDVRSRCFDPFFTTRRDGAVGLGLSIALASVLRHGGRISVKSALGEGSAFTVLLPLGGAPATNADGTEPGAVVLISSPIARLRCFNTLEASGVQPLFADDASQAARALAMPSITLLAVDAAALCTYGEELARILRSRPRSVACLLVENAQLPEDASPFGPDVIRVAPDGIERAIESLRP